MCLMTTTPSRVLKEDMTVYKILMKDLTSSIQGFQYELNKEYITCIQGRNEYLTSSLTPVINYKTGYITKVYSTFHIINIHEGFHAYKEIPFTVEELRISNALNGFYFNQRIVVRCTLPKGSLVYENDEEIVSTKIIINKILY